jgi:hypothetical protein
VTGRRVREAVNVSLIVIKSLVAVLCGLVLPVQRTWLRRLQTV